MRQKEVELLAPAGSIEAMKAVFAAGADAVYMGGPLFGARAYADNPDNEGFLEAIEYAHVRGKKIYMTVNTLLKEKEISNMLYDYLLPFYLKGLDAVIVQDLGVFDFIKEAFPGLPIHISTQMTVTGADSARDFKEKGASRVVTARELNLTELKKISDTGIEVESFVHGAICYCYSGKCLFSSLAGGRSGNRGRCAQPCRQAYDLYDEAGHRINQGKERYLLSLKDMNTLDILPDIINAGVYSLKIEGRMKKPEYAAGVVSIYRKYIDMYLSGEHYEVAKQDQARLYDLFNRNGFSNGYYNQKNGRDMMSLTETEFRSHDAEFNKEIKENYIDKELKAPLNIYAAIIAGEDISLSVSSQDHYEAVSGGIPEKSLTKPTTRQQVIKQLSKLGNTDFELGNLELFMDEDVFVPVSVLNELRRNAVSSVRAALIDEYTRDENSSHKPADKREEAVNNKRIVSAYVSDIHQLMECCKCSSIERIYIAPDLCSLKELAEICSRVKEGNKECYYTFFEPLRLEHKLYYEKYHEIIAGAGFDGFLCDSVESLCFAEKHFKGNIVAGHSLYSWNSRALAKLLERCSMATAPLELKQQELRNRGMKNTELIVYGYSPMMVTAGCVFKSAKGCMKKAEISSINGELRDNSGRRFPVKTSCMFCGNTIYNLAPLVLFDQKTLIDELNPAGIRLCFTKETAKETKSVLEQFMRGTYTSELTRGAIKRGVE